jgi:hypothetical protein
LISKKTKKAMGLKWVFKIKYFEDDNILKHMARIVATGFSQQLGVDFIETFMSIVRSHIDGRGISCWPY